MKTFLTCPKCNKVYYRDDVGPGDCETCSKVALSPIKQRFILRCTKCGYTQNMKPYMEFANRNSLRCQNSTCQSFVKAILLGPKAIQDKIGDSAEVPKMNIGKSQFGDQKLPIVPERRILPTGGKVTANSSPNPTTTPSASKTPSGSNSELFNFFGARPPELGKLNRELKMKEHPGIQPGDILELDGDFFEVIGKLGTGGMGAVHKAQNVKTKVFVAIKEFYYTRYHDSESGENKCETYWKREQKISKIQAESQERCMHYVGALKIDQYKIPEYYIFIEFIEGKTMDKWYIDRYKSMNDLTIKELRMMITRLLMPIARHIFFVHQKGIVHRDITVQNIMIIEDTDGPTPIVIDWGVAKEIGIEKMYNPRKPFYNSGAPEATGIRNRGTPPEVMAGFEPFASTDIYMLGHVMYFLFSGGHYCGTAATNEDFVLHPLNLNPNLPQDFNQMVESMTQYEPADRMPSMVKVYDALKYLFDSTAILENPSAVKETYYLYCDYNQAQIPLPFNEVITLGRDEIINAGIDHNYDGHLYNALIPKEGEMYQFQLFLDANFVYIQDRYSKMGCFLQKLTMPNQQIYNNVAIKGMSNCYIPLSDANIGITIIEVPFDAPDGITYRIPFKIIKKT